MKKAKLFNTKNIKINRENSTLNVYCENFSLIESHKLKDLLYKHGLKKNYPSMVFNHFYILNSYDFFKKYEIDLGKFLRKTNKYYQNLNNFEDIIDKFNGIIDIFTKNRSIITECSKEVKYIIPYRTIKEIDDLSYSKIRKFYSNIEKKIYDIFCYENKFNQEKLLAYKLNVLYNLDFNWYNTDKSEEFIFKKIVTNLFTMYGYLLNTIEKKRILLKNEERKNLKNYYDDLLNKLNKLLCRVILYLYRYARDVYKHEVNLIKSKTVNAAKKNHNGINSNYVYPIKFYGNCILEEMIRGGDIKDIKNSFDITKPKIDNLITNDIREYTLKAITEDRITLDILENKYKVNKDKMENLIYGFLN
jgi:hypothetical protein